MVNGWAKIKFPDKQFYDISQYINKSISLTSCVHALGLFSHEDTWNPWVEN